MAHRKLDVDALDEDRFLEDDELANARPSAGANDEDGGASAVGSTKATFTNVNSNPPRTPKEIEQDLVRIASVVRNHLSRGEFIHALGVALERPAVGREDQRSKDKYIQLVMEIMASVRSSDIGNVVRSLSVDQVDLIMKYIYRAMATPSAFSSVPLLAWHEKVYEIGGVGSIVRVLTDRKTV